VSVARILTQTNIFYNTLNIGNQYYLEDEFNALFTGDKTIMSSFSLLHVNARSLSKNLDNLIVYLSGLKHKFSVLAISETWATADNKFLKKIPGYNCVMKNRVGCRGGGVALYVINTLSFVERSDLNDKANSNFECVFIEIRDANFGCKTVGAVYRPPDSNLDMFRSGFDAVLDTIKQSKTEYLIAVDYNLDLLKYENCEGTELFVNNLYAHSLMPLITTPTQFGKTSSSLIYNIFTNKPNDASLSGILISDVSDHLQYFTYLKLY
jgi:hypothetical protein